MQQSFLTDFVRFQFSPYLNNFEDIFFAGFECQPSGQNREVGAGKLESLTTRTYVKIEETRKFAARIRLYVLRFVLVKDWHLFDMLFRLSFYWTIVSNSFINTSSLESNWNATSLWPKTYLCQKVRINYSRFANSGSQIGECRTEKVARGSEGDR